MKKIFIAALALTLIGCNSVPGPTVTKLKVVTPSETMYACPLYREFPNPDKLTDVQVARMLVTLYGNNVKCYNAIQSIRKFLNNAKETVETPRDTAQENMLPYWQ